MKKVLLYTMVIVLYTACSSVKKTQKAINTGDYSNAINISIENLAKNKTKSSNQPYIVLLEEAFKKNAERELRQIEFLKKDENPANYESIYRAYVNLHEIQERIKPLLPLRINDDRRNAKFSFKNYTNDIIDSKDDLSEYLYTNASYLLGNANSKNDYRKAYDDFSYLEEIHPGYDDVKQKIDLAYAKGIDYVKVVMTNASDQIVPRKLEDELLNFNTYGLNDLWIKYHTNPLTAIDYDYQMNLAFQEIIISPEHLKEKQIIKEKQIKDGYRYAVDTEGNAMKDSLGNKIKIDRFKTVNCSFYQFTQSKTARVAGTVSFIDLSTDQKIDSYPLASEFVFEHVYASHEGDKRALDNDLVALLKLAKVPFPSNEQMVYEAGEDLKLNLRSILTKRLY